MEVSVDGVRFAPVTPSVGIAVSTRNRPDVLSDCLSHLRDNTPAHVPIVVVDDASEPFAVMPTWPAKLFRFETNVGIAATKNKCLELLMELGVEHLVLLDDDCWPIKQGWLDLYTQNPEPHLCYLFKNVGPGNQPLAVPPEIYNDGTTFAYTHPRGCLLYFHRSAIERIGGMRTVFGLWGDEHVEISERIHSVGLTTCAFQDAVGSKEFIYSCDENFFSHPNFTRSVPALDRTGEALERNAKIRESLTGSTDYVEYRQLPNVVITTLLTKQPDPQRLPKKMQPDPALIGKWLASLQNCTPVVLVDELESTDPMYVTMPTCLNPYLQRWTSVYQYLRDHPAQWVWTTDGTDVEMQYPPWEEMQPDTLYVGYEPKVVGIPWMRDNHPPYQQWIDNNANLQLLNAGVVGGDFQTILAFTHAMVREIASHQNEVGVGDMASFNFVCHSPAWRDKIEWGSKIVTIFKQQEANDFSWFRHK